MTPRRIENCLLFWKKCIKKTSADSKTGYKAALLSNKKKRKI